MTKTNKVRHFRVDDIDAVASLRARCFRTSEHDDERGVAARIREVFFDSPWAHEDFPSFVFETADGKVAGFLGVVPRPVEYSKERLWMAVPTQFMVEPGSKGALAIALTRALLAGNQDLSYADQCNDVTRSLWEHLGFHALHVSSLTWMRPIQPMRHALDSLASDHASGALVRSLRPIAWLFDKLLTGSASSRFALLPSDTTVEFLSLSGLYECMNTSASKRHLVAVHDFASFSWLVSAAGGLGEKGALRAIAIRDGVNSRCGWCMFRPSDNGRVEVVGVGGDDSLLAETLLSLCRAAQQDGAVVVQGRVQSRLFADLAGPPFSLARRGPWTVVHSRRPDLMEAMLSGRFDLSRLDGEWWMNF